MTDYLINHIKPSHPDFRREAENLADSAANEAVAEIQRVLGVKHGDFAGVYFQEGKWEELIKILADYTQAEVVYRSTP